jgi:hypothetical protein
MHYPIDAGREKMNGQLGLRTSKNVRDQLNSKRMLPPGAGKQKKCETP